MRWTIDKVNAYCAQFPWGYGANFSPSNAINQLEMWQEDTFSPDLIDKELGYAERIGMTLMRVYLHDLAYLAAPVGFLKRVETYLAIAQKHKIRTLLTIFDDCWNDNPKIGTQPAPKPFTHNSGWVRSPGNAPTENTLEWPRLEQYVKALIKHFSNDPRIFGWDIYNEPGNSERLNKSFPFLKVAFSWAREAGNTQPLTCGLWHNLKEFEELNAFMAEESDVLSYHCYTGMKEFLERMAEMKALAQGRRIICTEYLARPNNTFQEMLPIFKREGIDAINWGLVSGKTQTIYPWGWTEEKGKPERYHHDVFNTDGTLLHPEEDKVFKDLMKCK